MYKWYLPSKTMPAQPWLHPKAIEYLESILTPDMCVTEFGGGGSTLWLSEKVSSVTTYENNIDWYKSINQFIPDNVTLINSDTWKGHICNLLFIDGEPVEKRKLWIKQACNISDNWIVLDNANRPEYAEERKGLEQEAKLIHTVNGNETGTRYLVTEFWKIL